MSKHTCLLVHREHRNLGTSAPCRNLGYLIKESLDIGLRAMVLLELQDNTEVLGFLR